jgi:hypothetical protein
MKDTTARYRNRFRNGVMPGEDKERRATRSLALWKSEIILTPKKQEGRIRLMKENYGADVIWIYLCDLSDRKKNWTGAPCGLCTSDKSSSCG